MSNEVRLGLRFSPDFLAAEPSLRRRIRRYPRIVPIYHSLNGGPRVNNAIAEALDRGGQYHCEYRVRQSDGLYRWIEANGRVEFDADGRALRFPGVLLDIQQRRATEAGLQKVSRTYGCCWTLPARLSMRLIARAPRRFCNAAFIRVMGFSRLEDTDVGLPGGMNGRQVADAARVTRPSLKVLFVTGFAENAAVGNGHLEPGMEVITKPFIMADFARKIADMIAR